MIVIGCSAFFARMNPNALTGSCSLSEEGRGLSQEQLGAAILGLPRCFRSVEDPGDLRRHSELPAKD